MKRIASLILGVGLLAVSGNAHAQLKLDRLLRDLTGSKPAPAKGQPAGNIITDSAGILQWLLTGITLEEELQIGGSVAVEIVSRFGGILQDTNATDRVNLIGKSIARYGNRPELNYRFGVMNSPDVNAFSAPGGYVFITQGLYAMAANDDQLAGILAHEIAHVTQRHALKIIARNNSMASAIRIGASTSSDMRVFGQGIESLATTLLEQGFDPQSEYEADREGRRIARIAGYAPDGLREVLEALQQRGDPARKTFSTHPPLASRLGQLSATNSPAAPSKKTSTRSTSK